jgi:serralysin
MTLHYTSGGSAAAVATAGFNLVDVQTVEQLDALPEGTMGLVWLNEGDGVTASFLSKVQGFAGNPKLFGFFLVDEPDPTGLWKPQVNASSLMAESDWIHSNLPGAKTFITMMDMGSSDNPNFANTYNPANTHIDYFGLDPYPVRSEAASVDYNMIDRTVAAAVASGIPLSQIVPVFQAFGGGTYVDDMDGKYVVPTPSELQAMMDKWQGLVPSPAFDYAYAWGSQQGDTALESLLDLQAVFLHHNTSTSDVDQNLSGDNFANSITGGNGNDTIHGLGGDDTMFGLAGNDILVGGAGADVMQGGSGSDMYFVDNVKDRIDDTGGGVSDRVFASVSYALAAGQEIEILTTTNTAGLGAINLTGNAFNQIIHGNGGDNVLNGGGGADRMCGFGGNDQYFVDAAGDVVVEAAGGGTDRVFASVSCALAAGQEIEILTTTNTAGLGAINLTGNAFSQIIHGNGGDNVLNGGAGNDVISGFGGSDIFLFNTALNAAANMDVIKDFTAADDTIFLHSAVFNGLGLGALAAGAFNTGSAASQTDDRIIYNTATGALLFDADGSGGAAAIQFALLSGHPSVTAADFVVI